MAKASVKSGRTRGRPRKQVLVTSFNRLQKLKAQPVAESVLRERIETCFSDLTGEQQQVLSREACNVALKFCGEIYMTKRGRGPRPIVQKKFLFVDCARAWSTAGCPGDPWQRVRAFGAGRAPATQLAHIIYECTTGKPLMGDTRAAIASAKRTIIL